MKLTVGFEYTNALKTTALSDVQFFALKSAEHIYNMYEQSKNITVKIVTKATKPKNASFP